MSSVAHAVSLFEHHQISSNTGLNSVFGEFGYLADEAEMGLIRLVPFSPFQPHTYATNSGYQAPGEGGWGSPHGVALKYGEPNAKC